MNLQSESERLGRAIDERVANPRDLRWALDGEKLKAACSLIVMLETAFEIIQNHERGEPEPFPGAKAEAIRQSLQAVEALRRSGVPFLTK